MISAKFVHLYCEEFSSDVHSSKVGKRDHNYMRTDYFKIVITLFSIEGI